MTLYVPPNRFGHEVEGVVDRPELECAEVPHVLGSGLLTHGITLTYARRVNAASAVAVAAIFVWVGMVLAISFLEAPLKFRAPGVTLPVGLSIGRLVFRALNGVETVLAVTVVVTLLVHRPATGALAAAAVAIVCLVVQIVAVRPRLSRRSDAVLAGAEGPRSHAHYWYVGFEVVKLVALIVSGALLLTAA